LYTRYYPMKDKRLYTARSRRIEASFGPKLDRLGEGRDRECCSIAWIGALARVGAVTDVRGPSFSGVICVCVCARGRD
jgi:hypothetical protein